MSEKLPSRDLSDFKLKSGLWVVKRWFFFKKSFIFVLIFSIIAIYSYNIWQAINLFIIHNEEQQILLDHIGDPLIDYSYWRDAQKPQDIRTSEIIVLATHGDKKDFAVQITNPNPNFVVAKIQYQFLVNGQLAYEGESFLYPMEQKFAGAYNQTTKNDAPVSFVVTDLSLQRVDQDFGGYLNIRRAFKIDNIEFIPSDKLKDRGDIPISQTRFRIVNESTFSYWRVPINLYLYSGERLVGINTTRIDKVVPLAAQNVTVNWYMPGLNVTRIEVVPDLNILDESIYMEYIVEPGERK